MRVLVVKTHSNHLFSIYGEACRLSPDRRKPMKYVLQILAVIVVGSLVFDCFSQENEAGNVEKKILTLEDCLKISREENLNVLRAREELERTKGVVKEGYSGAFPKIDATGSYTRIDESSIQEFEGIRFGSDEIYSASFGLTQKLYAGGKVGAGIRAAKLADSLSRTSLITTERQVDFEVKQAFYLALLTRDLIDVQVETVNLFSENLKNVEAKREEGQVSDYEVLRAKVALSNIQPDLIRARNNNRLALDNLKQILNLPLDNLIEVQGELGMEEMSFVLGRLVETAMANRSEIVEQEITIKLREQNLRLAKSGKKPEVSFTGNYAGETQIFGESDPSDLLWGWRAGIVFTMPLFDGFETKGRVIQRIAELKQSKIDLEATKKKIELDVRQAYFKFNEAVEVLESQRKNTEQAEESVRQSRVLADLGQVTQFDLRDAQLELRTARTNLESALYEYDVAIARLENAIGYNPEKLNTAGK